MRSILALALLIASAAAFHSPARVTAPTASCPECGLSLAQVITYWGYPVQEFTVQTDDGFNLNLLRIPFGASNSLPSNQPRPAVLLQHGLLDSGMTWLVNLPHQSLGFILADQGFDVWIGNNRGNTFSKPNCSSQACWDFSFHEMGTHDLPSYVNFILAKTGLPSVAYIGHSQGTIQAFLGFTQSEELQQKVNLFVALAPVTYVHNQKAPLFSFLAGFNVDKLIQLFGIKEFLPNSQLISSLGGLCKVPVIDGICDNALFSVCGVNPEVGHNMNQSRIDVYVSHAPAGTSVKNMAHWAQLVRTNRFGAYDYGTTENKKRYGQETAPDYDLSKIKVPVALFTGGQDLLGDPYDVEQLLAGLPSSSIVFNQKVGDYNHLDLVWGMDAHYVIYPNVIEQLTKFAPSAPAKATI